MAHVLSPQQLRFFETFGYLGFPGLLAAEIGEVIAAFEQVWEERGGGHDGRPHDGERRSCIVPFMDQHPRLCALLDQPQIHGILCDLLGDDFDYLGSDGNYYAGDTQWHSDGWAKTRRFVKIAFYLDSLTRDTGCLRVIPGSHHLKDAYAEGLQAQIRESREQWGVAGADLPAVALEVEPGDVVLFNHNTKHASFGGGGRRRMFTLNACQRFAEADLPQLREWVGHAARF